VHACRYEETGVSVQRLASEGVMVRCRSFFTTAFSTLQLERVPIGWTDEPDTTSKLLPGLSVAQRERARQLHRGSGVINVHDHR
jgi:hypothetical protein